MTNQAQIRVFTKSNCSYCELAKKSLAEAGLEYIELNVEQDKRHADASVYFSGQATVPQIFIGDYNVKGGEDLAALQKSGRLLELVASNKGRDLPLSAISDEALAAGAEDMLFREQLPPFDVSRSDDPEMWPILNFYKGFFGFWPHCGDAMGYWPPALKLFLLCQNIPTIKMCKEVLGEEMIGLIAYATSNAHGCNYCQTHAVAVAGDHVPGLVNKLKAAWEDGTIDPEGPLGEYEVALCDVAAATSKNSVSPALLQKVMALAPKARKIKAPAPMVIGAVGMLSACFGYNNVLNDLTAVEVEGDWMKTAETVGIEAGRHGASETNPVNLDYDIPTDGPTLPEMVGKIGAKVDDVVAYAHAAFGVMPAWISGLPAPLQKSAAYMNAELFGEGGECNLPAELKRLMARVSAIAKGHVYLAAIEGYIAHHVSDQPARTIERVKHCYAVASGIEDAGELFDAREVTALKLAWISAQIPLVTTRHYVEDVLTHFNTIEIMELFATCASASMVQRWVAVAQPKLEPEVQSFVEQHHIETDGLALRYPMRA